MTITIASKPLMLLVAATLALGVSACSGGPTPAPAEPVETAPEPSDTSDTGHDGRAFDSTDDAVIIAVEAAMSSKNAKAEWQGTTLHIALDGSAGDPTEWIYCGAAQAVIADDESVMLVYSDGELNCDERPGS